MEEGHLSAEYVAGLFDGEGTVGVYDTNAGAQVMLHVLIYNTYYPILESLQTQYGGTIVKAGVKGGTAWGLRLRATEMRTFLQAIAPHVVIKRRQVELALEYLATVPEIPYRGRWNQIPDGVRAQRQKIARELRVEKRSYKRRQV